MTHRRTPDRGWCYLAGLMAGLVMAVIATADDRDLLRERAGEPLVFVTFDTSGSMATTPPCTRDQAVNDMNPFDAMCTTECPLGSDTCARVCPDFGCREYDFSSVSEPEVDARPPIVLDENDATLLPDAWTEVTGTASAEGDDYRHDGRSRVGEPVLKSAVYDPGALTGDYMVFLWWPQDADVAVDVDGDGVTDPLASNALVDVQIDADTKTTLAVDQRLEGGRWNPIGTWKLESAGQVTIRNESGNGLVVADAVGWLPVTVPGCKDGEQVYRCQQPICPTGSCYAKLNGDDPNSKFFQAKEALFGAMSVATNTFFGFATFEQDNPRLRAKHWLYRVRAADNNGLPHQPPKLEGTPFIAVGDEEVFGNYSREDDPNPGASQGDGFDCVTGGDPDQRVGCVFSDPADLSDPWETERARRIPKLGRLGNLSTEAWYRVGHDDTKVYKVVYSPYGGSVTFGDPVIGVEIEIFRMVQVAECGNGFCEITAGENCITCALDCGEGEASGSPGDRFCCGAEECNDYPVDCSDPRCVLPSGDPVMCTEDVILDETLVGSGTIFYDLVSDYVAQDGRVGRQPMEEAGFFQGESNVASNDSCQGLDPNDDSVAVVGSGVEEPQDDDYRDYNLRWETEEDPRGDDFDGDGVPEVPRLTFFDVGDFVPLDWEDDNRTLAMTRLAPNTIPVGPDDSPPDFRTARYFENDVSSGDDPDDPTLRKLRLAEYTAGTETVVERPIIPSGSTPIGESLADFRQWFAGADASEEGWKDFAVLADPLWPCRQTSILLLTDGVDECFARQCVDEDGHPFACTKFDNDPCTLADELFRVHGVKTYVVAFGVGDGSSLNCIAENGGTESPLLPQNKEELLAALDQVFGDILVGSRAFASASIPAVQSSTADKIFLSSFIPFPDTSFWFGEIDAFRKPLPLTPEKKPDVGRKCFDIDDADATLQSGCHVWEAGQMLCEQAPEAAAAATGDFRLGDDPAAERRVVYGQESAGTVPNALQLFDLPEIPMAEDDPLPVITADFLKALDPSKVDDWNAESLTPAQLRQIFQDVIAGTLSIKVIDPAFEDDLEGCVLSGGGEGYVLGDVFHANPVSLADPGNFTYLANDGVQVGASTDPTVIINGYRDFARKHFWRRKMLAAPSNDGQVHFFDSGIRQVLDNTFTPAAGDTIEVFNDGSGHELFSYIPRFALPVLNEQVKTTQHIFSVDNTLAIGDVFIDPQSPQVEDEREWRSVVIGSAREGGDVFQQSAPAPHFKGGYFALDVTQPDILNPRSDGSGPTWIPCPESNADCDQDTTSFPTEYTPSCLDFFTSSDGSQSTPAACDYPFPMELWTFADSVKVPGASEPFYLDEDEDSDGRPQGNGIPDLAESWSRPVIGAIQVCRVDGGQCDPNDPDGDGDLRIVQVAIFAGGMDARRKGESEVGGNFLYMVDVETGEAIYKRELEGSAPADPAVLDINRDGLFDRIYVGTTAGKLYKVDLNVRSATGDVPGFDDPTYTVDEDNLLSLDAAGNPAPFSGSLAEPIALRRISDDRWDPFVILDTEGTPIYHAPTAFFIPERNQYGLAVGTGDREDLWSRSNGEPVAPGEKPIGGRFFVVVDEDLENDPSSYSASVCSTKLPITKACLEEIAFTDTPDLAANYLLKPREDTANAGFPIRAGWVLTVTPQSRITSEAFVVAGVLVFSSFDSVIDRIDDDVQDFCAQTGTTRAFVVALQNAGPIAPLGLAGASGSDGSTTPGERDIDRYHEISEFTTAPFVDSTAGKNPRAEGDTILDEINDAAAESIRQALVNMFPRGTRFNAAYSLVIGALRNSTGVSVYATVPIGVYSADWRDQ